VGRAIAKPTISLPFFNQYFDVMVLVGVTKFYPPYSLLPLLTEYSISRNETIENVGIDWVELAKRQYEAMPEDLESAKIA